MERLLARAVRIFRIRRRRNPHDLCAAARPREARAGRNPPCRGCRQSAGQRKSRALLPLLPNRPRCLHAGCHRRRQGAQKSFPAGGHFPHRRGCLLRPPHQGARQGFSAPCADGSGAADSAARHRIVLHGGDRSFSGAVLHALAAENTVFLLSGHLVR